MVEVILEYKRVGMQSTGRITVRDGACSCGFFSFVELDFEPMLYKFAEALQEYPDAVGIIQRTDREGLVPYNLEPKILELFRVDPIAAVKSMTSPYGSPSTTAKRMREESRPIVPSLRVGHATLADAFGDELYSRYDKNREQVECPCCGIWASLLTRDSDGAFFIVCKNPSCAPQGKPLFVRSRNGRWASFLTCDLLATNSGRFYLPRAWNGGEIWITWDSLFAKYQEFQKEKKSCP